MFWVSEQQLVDQVDTIRSNGWMTELEIEKLEKNLAENDSYKEKEKSVDDTGKILGEKLKDTLTALEADDEITNLGKEEVFITEEIAEVLQRRQKAKLPAPKDIEELLKELLKLIKFCVNIKHTPLQRLMNYFMQGLLLLLISWQ